MPLKTTLALLTFLGLILAPEWVPGLADYKSLDWRNIPAVLDFPLRKSSVAEEELRLKPVPEIPAQKTLIDPAGSLNFFYASLLENGVTQIAHYGDSPTTADLITADARDMFQRQFGDAGHGFVLIGKPWGWYRHRGVEIFGSGWKIDPAGQSEVRDGMFGLGGVSFRGSPGALAHIRVRDRSHRKIEIAFLALPEPGEFVVEAEGQPIGVVETSAIEKKPAWASFELPENTGRITIRVTNGMVRLFGVHLQKPGPGVVYHSLGLNGAYVSMLARITNERHWTEQLRHYRPALVIVNYGTNESIYPKFVDYAYAKEMREVVRRIRSALPEASILVMSPMDRGIRQPDGSVGTVPVMPRLVALEGQVAQETGCAFFNTFEAMGGPGTMGRWYEAEPRLVGADFIHPMPAGARVVGELLFKALMEGYNGYKLRLITLGKSGASRSKAP